MFLNDLKTVAFMLNMKCIGYKAKDEMFCISSTSMINDVNHEIMSVGKF